MLFSRQYSAGFFLSAGTHLTLNSNFGPCFKVGTQNVSFFGKDPLMKQT